MKTMMKLLCLVVKIMINKLRWLACTKQLILNKCLIFVYLPMTLARFNIISPCDKTGFECSLSPSLSLSLSIYIMIRRACVSTLSPSLASLPPPPPPPPPPLSLSLSLSLCLCLFLSFCNAMCGGRVIISHVIDIYFHDMVNIRNRLTLCL